MAPKAQYERVHEQLKKEIVEQAFKPGDKLPSEKRLCDYFKVSRVTVRHALQQLEHEGLIYRKQGVGAFVSEKRMHQSIVQLTDYSEDMKRAGYKSSSRLIDLKKVKADKFINSVLELKPDAPLIKVDRVRLANNRPIAFDETWLPASYGQLLFDEDLTNQTIYQVFEDKYDIPIIGGRYKITATCASEYISSQLEVPEGEAVLEIDRCSRTTGNKKIYFQKRYNNPAFISYELELLRNENSDELTKHELELREFVPKFYAEKH